jgi:hypothetical protein
MRQPTILRSRPARRHASVAAVLASALAAAAGPAGAAPDGGELIARLARRPPSSIAFTEVRLSPLLNEPLVVRGVLDYADAETLQRRVESPYQETTTLRGETARIERDGEAPRTFALRRAPELKGLLAGMTGLLRGDAAALAADFAITASGDDERWRLELAPENARLRERLTEIVVLGRGNEPYCYVLRDERGGASVMLLGDAAAQPLPQSAALPELLDRCAAE